jgi:hypothetical protein
MKIIKTFLYGTSLYFSSFALHADAINHQNKEDPSIQSIEATEEIGDLFPGTIQRISNRYILKRCTSGGDDYVLEFSNPKDQAKIDELLANKHKFWVNTFAIYHEVNGEHHLKVNDLYEIFMNQSCHLNDFLEQLEENPELFEELKKSFPQKNRE